MFHNLSSCLCFQYALINEIYETNIHDDWDIRQEALRRQKFGYENGVNTGIAKSINNTGKGGKKRKGSKY